MSEIIKGTAVLFADNKGNEMSIVFRAAVDDVDHVTEMVAKFAADGYKPIDHKAVVYTSEGWRVAEPMPSLRQLLGMRPVWKLG